jgi:hypothetical protein
LSANSGGSVTCETIPQNTSVNNSAIAADWRKRLSSSPSCDQDRIALRGFSSISRSISHS